MKPIVLSASALIAACLAAVAAAQQAPKPLAVATRPATNATRPGVAATRAAAAGTRPLASARVRPAPHPPAREVTIQSQQDAFFDFFEKYVVEAYEDSGHRDPRWDANAVSLLEQASYIPQYADDFWFWSRDRVVTAEQLLPLARAVIEEGCDDPVVLWKAAMLLHERSTLTDLWQGAASRAADGIEASHYLPAVRARVMLDCALALSEPPPARINGNVATLSLRTPPLKHVPQIAKLLGQAMSDKSVLPEHRREVRTMTIANLDDSQRAQLAPALEKLTDADPWLFHELMGRVDLGRAWNARGGDVAATLTPQQIAGFDKYLRSAADHFDKAIAAAPKLPEPYAEMLTVCMGRGDGHAEKQAWFGKALALQPDLMLTYALYFNAEQPRWGGSNEAVLQAARDALAGARFDTAVPFVFPAAVEAIERTNERRMQGEEFERVYVDIVNCLEGYLNNSKQPLARAWARNARAVWAARKQDLGEVYRQAQLMRNEKIEFSTSYLMQHGVGPELFLRRAIEVGSPQADELRKAMMIPQHKQRAAAFAALIAKLPEGDITREFAEDRRKAAEFSDRFGAGEWTPLPEDLYVGFHPTGDVTRLKSGDYDLATGPDGRFYLKLPPTLSPAFEVRFRVRPVPPADGSAPDKSALIAVRSWPSEEADAGVRPVGTAGVQIHADGAAELAAQRGTVPVTLAPPDADGFYAITLRITPTLVAVSPDAQGKERTAATGAIRQSTLLIDTGNGTAPARWQIRGMEFHHLDSPAAVATPAPPPPGTARPPAARPPTNAPPGGVRPPPARPAKAGSNNPV